MVIRIIHRSMSREKDIITRIANQLPRSDKQLNNLFESDSEIIQLDFTKLLFTVDEFSDEDHFRDHDPYILGWNLTVATISDILASGGLPRYYGHSVMIDKNKWDDFYLEHFSVGIADVLRKSKAFLLNRLVVLLSDSLMCSELAVWTFFIAGKVMRMSVGIVDGSRPEWGKELVRL